jgi:hypothetical protein
VHVAGWTGGVAQGSIPPLLPACSVPSRCVLEACTLQAAQPVTPSVPSHRSSSQNRSRSRPNVTVLASHYGQEVDRCTTLRAWRTLPCAELARVSGFTFAWRDVSGNLSRGSASFPVSTLEHIWFPSRLYSRQAYTLTLTVTWSDAAWFVTNSSTPTSATVQVELQG